MSPPPPDLGPSVAAERLRETQCGFRRSGCCDLLNIRLGWRHGCPLPDCDRCYALGQTTPEAEEHRERLAVRWLAFVKKNVSKANLDIIRVLIRDHLTPEETKALANDPEIPWALSRTTRWAAVSSTWDMADSWIRAISSRGLTGKRTSLTIKGRRHVSCTGNTPEGSRVSDPCPALRPSSDGRSFFCSECGCGDKPSARITSVPPSPPPETLPYEKLDYPDLMCPRGRPGFSNEGSVPPPVFTLPEGP